MAGRKRRPALPAVLLSRATLPEYDSGNVPEGLVTRRQLRALNVSPGGHGPVGILRCKACRFRPGLSCTHRTRAWLFSLDLARPKRKPTLAQEWALDRAMAARQTCPDCERRYHYCLPLRTQGCCNACNTGTEPTPATYTAPPAKHLLAA
ncbi:RRQRL motif-containing zinc-binding protein [Streptomyces sp. NBC_01708]|uniref:RRQRL motif-containing zinc-binding protein n=1 Tax=Streptomyces sp. NBC_01708 TaxID=2975915 RepID=UPI002E33748E|nr:RRQRL motif-containing zinc-binding protein [Streptomyces sp. NBC_01708]